MIQTSGIGLVAIYAQAKEHYSKIGRIACPFFNGELIAFNRRGFKHLIRRGPKMRTVAEQLMRLRLVEFAEQILKNQNTTVVVEVREGYEIKQWVNRAGTKILQKKQAKSWGFIATIEGSEITLVVSQIEGGQKEFLSIMAKNYRVHPLDTAIHKLK
jgi:hypothetical protein